MNYGYVVNLGDLADLLSPLWVYRDGLSVIAGFVVFIVWDWWQTQQLNAAATTPPPQPHGLFPEKRRH